MPAYPISQLSGPPVAGKVEATPATGEAKPLGWLGRCMGAQPEPEILAPEVPPPFCSAESKQVKVKKVVVIFNPVAGLLLAKKIAETMLVPQLTAAGVQAELKPTEYAGHAAELARTLPLKGVDALIAIGGDGTLSEVVNGYMARAPGSGACPLGFIPGGSGNSVCRDLNLPSTSEEHVTEAVRRIVAGRTKKFDLIKVEGSTTEGKPVPAMWSFNIVAWGLGTDANARAEDLRCLGPARYDVAILAEILKFEGRSATLTIDGGAPLAMPSLMLTCVQNNMHTGAGLRTAPLAQLDDGLFDVWYSLPANRGEALAEDADVKAGGKHIYRPEVHYHRATRLRIETPKPTQYMVDGDLQQYTPLQLEMQPGAIDVFF